MRPFAPRVGDAARVVDPPTRSPGAVADDGDPPAKASGNQLLRRSHQAPSPRAPAFNGHRLDEKPRPHARQERQASLIANLWRAGRDQKSPVRRCFKPRPPFGRGAPVRLRLPIFQGRLTGLLSRSPPTDTRPQARAYWAGAYLGKSRLSASGFFPSPEQILQILRDPHAAVGYGENRRAAFGAAAVPVSAAKRRKRI